MEKEPEANPKKLLVYVGPCMLQVEVKGKTKSQLGATFYLITEDEFKAGRLEDRQPVEQNYGGKTPKAIGRPGTVYEFEHPKGDTTRIYSNTRSYKGFLENEPRCSEWQARADAFAIEQKMVAMEKAGKSRNLIHEHLAPIKLAYSEMVGHNRHAFLAMVIAYITGKMSNEDFKLAAKATKEEWGEE